MPSANKLLTYLFYSWRKHDVTCFFSRIAHLPIALVTQLNCYATSLHSRFHSTRYVATELTRPKSSELCHLVFPSATCVWDQSLWHWWAATASTASVMQLEAVTDRKCSWPMANMLMNFCSCQRWTFWIYSVTINLFSLHLINFMFHTMLDAAGDVLEVHYQNIKCDVSLSQTSTSTLFRWGGHYVIHV